MQTIETWRDFIETETVVLGSNSTKLYCEEDDFTDFMDRLKTFDMDYVHDVKEHGWGQGAVRFKDPDKHIIEVGESIKTL